ncbi:CPBP family intramembrane glutamic endopeptidase [Gallicola sp. Sow4_E12]|uniref:CPBP family intramembrane glutamic endopeptidase n=1 Tax=Gallicola sp. Sow4_E12 TaxID=3438785 RepID=UPI003F8EC214
MKRSMKDFLKKDLAFILVYLGARAAQLSIYQSGIRSFNMTLDDMNRIDNDGFVFVYLFLNLLPLAVILLFNRLHWKDSHALGLTKKYWGRNLISGFLMGLIVVFLYNGITLGLRANILMGVSNTFYPPYILVYLIGFLIQVFHGELLMRGFVFHRLQEWIKHTYALALSVGLAALFSVLVHITTYPFSLLTIVNTFLWGLFLCLLVLDSKDIWLAAGFHFGWNYIQSVFFSHIINGIHTNTTFLHIAVNKDYPLLTGGAYGPLASLITTLILLLLTTLYIFKIDRTKKQS